MFRHAAIFLSTALCSTALAGVSTPFISEIFINPPGTDGGLEALEIQAAPSTALTDYYFLVLEGGGTGAGTVDQVVSLGAFSTGSNGLLLIRDGATVIPPAPDGATTLVIQDFSPDIENGTNTYLLGFGTLSVSVGTDLDTDNNGTVDVSLGSFTVVDAVSYKESGTSSDIEYGAAFGGEDLGQFSFTPDALYRILDATQTSPVNWAGGDVLGDVIIGFTWDTPANEVFGFGSLDPATTTPNYGNINAAEGEPAAIGACCAADGSCTEVTETDCGTSGGTYSGDNTTCSPTDCPQPPDSGACCAPDGSCTEGTEGECTTSGGTYSGDGTTCTPNDCPQPPATGACCYEGICVDNITAADCVADFAGDYQGDGTDCDSVSCEILPPPVVVINEVWADDPGIDTAEFVELFGVPGTDLYNYSLIVVDGDTGGDPASSSYLQVDYQYDFGLTDVLDANGFFVFGTVAGADVSFPVNELENGTVTYAIVNTADIAYCIEDAGNPGFPVAGCDDIDTDELTSGSDVAITANAIDTVATADSTPLDHTYFGAPVVKDGTFEADYMQRLPNGVDTNTTADWDTQFGFELGAPGDTSSPDAVNHPPVGACCQADGSCSDVSEADCSTAGGTWNGQGSDCDPNPCPQPVGACCDGLGGCTDVSEDDCNLSGGTYQGDGSVCGDGSICALPPEGIVINEVWADDPSTDDVEFVELFGAAGTSLDGLSLIVIDGDTGGDPTNGSYLQVDYQVDFTAANVLDANGFFVLGSIAGADIPFAVTELENGTQTLALVNTADVAYCIEDVGNPGFPVGTCDDIDDDELTPESDAAISANATDTVATSDSGAGDHTYFGSPVVQDGTFPADFMHRIPNGVDTDSAADWQTQFNFEFGAQGDASTPDAFNTPGVGACCTGEACTIVSLADCENGGGAYQGQGSICDPADLCSNQTGACCIAGSCSDLTPSECTAAFGTFNGTGTACLDTDCSVACTTAVDARLLPDATEVNVCNAVIVSTTDLISSSTVKGIQIEDATGGVTVFGGNAEIDALLALATEGDQLDLVGTTDSFSGLFELAVPFGVSNVIPGVGLPTPDEITVADMQDGSATAEGFESELVRLSGVTFLAADGVATFAGATNYSVSSDGGATIAVVRVATNELDLVGQVIPTGVVNVTGIFSQFDSSSPFDGGYQLLPRTLADIEAVPPTPTGACCNGETCTDGVTEDDCTTGGGAYQGDASVCDAESCAAPCDGDANGDGQVDPLDGGFVQARFGCPVGTGDPLCDAADVNGDNLVDPLDYGYVLARFGACD